MDTRPHPLRNARLAFWALLLLLTKPSIAQTLPMSGPAIPALAPIDSGMSNFMTKYHIPGGAFGMVRNGKLIFVRGYGYADTNTLEKVQPDSLFRIASLSKSITAAGILLLNEQGRLSLDESAFGLLGYSDPSYPKAKRDPRLNSITVRQLLNHAGGWNRDKASNPDGNIGMDPTVEGHWTTRIASDMGTSAPASAETVVRWMTGQPLQFDPGTQYQYSNFGYTVLGRIIEKLTGKSYESYMQSALARAGITRMQIGGSRLSEKLPGEVVYYEYPDAAKVVSAFPADTSPVSDAYSRSVPTMDAHGGWVASAIDLLRFIAAVDGRPTPPDILSPASISNMTARPVPPWHPADITYYGMGWLVRTDSDNWWHSGALPGTGSEMIRAGNGISWVMLFNFRDYRNDTAFYNDMDRLGWNAQAAVTTWPAHDLFPTTLSYKAWKLSHFSANELAQPGVAGDLGDPDHDGLPNLLEYALGFDPHHPDDNPGFTAAITPSPTDSQPHLSVTYRRLLLEHEVEYHAEASPDLQSWLDLPVPLTAPTLNSDGTETVTCWDPAPASTSQYRFVRLRAVLKKTEATRRE